ncbi:MAG: hypothetical protein QNJ55_31840 [Xenococcus sp. MO_188.B8]|nr:hypothetical protein [Xenococcus sp. MO_188.B8]
MAANPFFSGRIPQALYDRIEEYREQTAETKSEILVRALAQYVDYPLGEEEAPPPIKQTLEEIFSRLATIESKIADYHQLSVDNKEQLSPDNTVITESDVGDSQPDSESNDIREYSDADLASMLEADRSTIGKIRRGKKRPSSRYEELLKEYEPSKSGTNWVKRSDPEKAD